jgi:hypothetical protein
MSTKYWTIDGFENLTREEIIRISVAHVLKNGKKSVKGDRCMYGGIGCAAAPFLKEQYRASADGRLEGSSKYGNSWRILELKGYVPHHEANIVRMLQSCHDNAPNISDALFIESFKHEVQIVFGGEYIPNE